MKVRAYRRGFSLLEVLIALAVMGVGMLGVAMLLTRSMSNMRSSRGSSTGNMILQQVIEQAQRQPWETFKDKKDNWEAPVWYTTTNAYVCGGVCPAGQVPITTQQSVGGTWQVVVQDVYQVEWKSVVGEASSSEGIPENMARIDLRLRWTDRGRATNQDREMYTTVYKYNWDE